MICMSLVIDRIQESLTFPEGALILSLTLEKDTKQEPEGFSSTIYDISISFKE